MTYRVEAESDDEDAEIDEVPKSTTRSRRGAAPRFVFHISRLLRTWTNLSGSKLGKGALAANKPPAKAKQTTLSFAPSGATSGRTSTRAAAGKARGKMAVIVSIHMLSSCSQILTATYILRMI